jgi:hypothetical protein
MADEQDKQETSMKHKASIACLAYFSTLKMEATSSFKTSVNFHEAVALYPRRYNCLAIIS